MGSLRSWIGILRTQYAQGPLLLRSQPGIWHCRIQYVCLSIRFAFEERGLGIVVMSRLKEAQEADTFAQRVHCGGSGPDRPARSITRGSGLRDGCGVVVRGTLPKTFCSSLPCECVSTDRTWCIVELEDWQHSPSVGCIVKSFKSLSVTSSTRS